MLTTMQVVLGLFNHIKRLNLRSSFYFHKENFVTMSGHAFKPSMSVIRENLMKYPGGCVQLTKDEQSGIATICFSNPKKKNAWTGNMMVQLFDVVVELEKWDAGKGVLFYSEGEDFCSGADLSLVGDVLNSDVGKHMCIIMQDAIMRLSQIPMISAVLAQGKAIGGGSELLTSCDFRLVTSDFQCNLVHLKMGLIPGWGGATRLVRLLGPTKSLELMSSCACLSANEALSLGLATAILDDEGDRLANALRWMKDYTVGEVPVLHAMKKAVVAASSLSSKESLEKEYELFMSVWGGPAFKTAVEKKAKK